MLKYNIKLGKENIAQEELVWGEKYLSPDLSYIKGVTSQDYHLERFDKLQVSSDANTNPNGSLPLEVYNVTRQGFVIIKGKKYKIYNGKIYNDNLDDKWKDYHCMIVNGVYYYANSISEGPLSKIGFIIDDFLVCDESTENVIPSSITITYPINAEHVSIDTIAWIEDGYVYIDGISYLYDFEIGKLRSLEYGNPVVESSSITKCDEIEFHPYLTKDKYEKVSKFYLHKNDSINEKFEKISHVEYFYYINYKDESFTIYLENDIFYCDVPRYLISGGTIEDGNETFEVKYIVGDDEVRFNSGETKTLSGKSFSVFDSPIIPFVIIENTKYYVQKEIINSNGGNKLAAYLTDGMNGLRNDDIITFTNNSISEYRLKVYNLDDDYFVIYNGKKYYAKTNLCDKISINGIEHNIIYNNGKKSEVDCLVEFGDTYKTFKINFDMDVLITYGKIVTNRNTVDSTSYPIITYSGVTIDGENYTIYNDERYNELYINFDKPKKYPFSVNEVIGSSMVVCEPSLSKVEFTDDFIKAYSEEVCNEIVTNQLNYGLSIRNNIFGTHEITEDIGFLATLNPYSSNDYFNLFDNLHVYCNSSFIHLPITLSTPQGNNLLQDDLVKRDFFEVEKNKAINPIIDMEKDIYTPKFMSGEYSGSDTVFYAVDNIRVNLHFRTRNLDTWKVNEDYNDSSLTNQCNWFITDFYPYNKYVGNSQAKDEDKEKIMNSSDLIGLMNFTNNDVFYQKSKISKSFLRFSYYDSTDQETQTLLATSTIFMDSSRLFKKYIDNSKKYYYQYKQVASNKDNSLLLNKISVDSELCGVYKRGTKCSSDPSINEDHRIGSEFIIKNKHQAETSSEGYYLHIFKEYSENLRPKPIYMKVEFNHAGIGRTIPFIIPMKWDKPKDSVYKLPLERLTLKDEDLLTLKKGIKLEDSYAQMYIPLYAVYDFKNKEYVYVFDSRYVDSNSDNITLNLFEIKYSDDSKTTASEDERKEERKEVTNSKQVVARININNKQFPQNN